MFYGERATVPRTASGGLNWNYTGPLHDLQWMLALNRHAQFKTLAYAYVESKDVRYITFLDALIVDWVAFVGRAPLKDSCAPGVTDCHFEPDWLTLDAGIRLGVWPSAFFIACGAPEFRDSTLLLLLASTIDHNEFLLQNPVLSNNWASMIESGMVRVPARHSHPFVRHDRKK